MRAWSQIAPLLEKLLQKEKVSLIFIATVAMSVGFDPYFDLQHYYG